jgi:hypothetical protein
MSEATSKAIGGATTLSTLAAAVKSANAGASWLTIDVLCHSIGDLERIHESISREGIAEVYRVSPSHVSIFIYPAALALKITLPRHSVAGDASETDFQGVQQHVLILGLPIVEIHSRGADSPGDARASVAS